MTQQIESNMASNVIHENCIQTNEDNNPLTLPVIDETSNKRLMSSSESNVESTNESEPVINGQIEDKSLSGDVFEPKAETSGQKNSEPTFVDESDAKSSMKYIRKTPTEMLTKIWEIIDSNEWHKSVDQLNTSLAKKMFNLFNVKLNENRFKQWMDSAIVDKLVILEEEDNKFRYVTNFEPKLFGEVTNDWFCFECHSVIQNEELMDCKKCFKAFHLNCLKGEHKLSKKDCFECLYCLRSADPNLNAKVDSLSKPEINKLISFVVNNLQLSYDPKIFESYAIEDSEKNRVLVFKPMDMITIRHKALTEQYNKLEEAVIDFKHFYHNFSVSKRDQLIPLKEFERRFNHEIKELTLCIDCYKYSSDISYDIEDNPHDWFTLVCDPPHELVFAKFGKYPWWPAKIIEKKAAGKQYDVRFFDPPDFSRAIVPIQRLRPIEGFPIEDEENELKLSLELMEKHIRRMREKGVYFFPTVFKPAKRSAKKHPKTDVKGSDRPLKKAKKTTNN